MPSPKWLTESGHKRKTYDRGKRGEKHAVRSLGAKATPRSGAGSIKGDARLPLAEGNYHVEVKTTAQRGFRITRDMIKKLRRDSGYNRIPLLLVQFVNLQGHTVEQWMVLPTVALTKGKLQTILE